MTLSPKFTFDPETHIYRLGDRVLPSVTDIIGAVIPRGYECAAWYLDRGKALHAAIHLQAKGKLDWSSVDDRIMGRLKAYRKFMLESGWTLIASETPMYSERLGFAGCRDALMLDKAKVEVLTDFKSSIEPQVIPQIGAYNILSPARVGLALHLREDGTYRAKWFTSSEMRVAGQVFLNALSLYGWMKQNGVLKE
jgi:hypothetical protein